MLYNPAGLAKAKRWDFYLGGNWFDYSLTFDRTGNDANGTPFASIRDDKGGLVLPFLGAAQRVGNLAFGEGIWAPPSMADRDFGAAGNTSPGRYDVMKQHAVILQPSVGAAYRVRDNLDVGVRATWGLSQLTGTTAVWGANNANEDPGLDGVFSLEVKDNFMPGFGAGVLFRPSPTWEIGAVYHSAIHVEAVGTASVVLGANLPVAVAPVADADAQCAPGGAIDALKTCLGLSLPQVVSVGGRYIVRDGRGQEKADLEVDVRWENWSRVPNTDVRVDGVVTLNGNPVSNLSPTVTRHGFEDVLAVRVGGSYGLAGGADVLELRAGLGYDTAAAPTSWTRLDWDGKERATFAGGLAYRLSSYRFDIGGQFIWEPAKDVTDVMLAQPNNVRTRVQPDPIWPVVEPSSQVYHPFNAGRYESSYFVLGAGVTAWF